MRRDEGGIEQYGGNRAVGTRDWAGNNMGRGEGLLESILETWWLC